MLLGFIDVAVVPVLLRFFVVPWIVPFVIKAGYGFSFNCNSVVLITPKHNHLSLKISFLPSLYRPKRRRLSRSTGAGVHIRHT